MSKIIIIDASVAIKWFVAQEDKTAEAQRVLDSIQQSPHLYSVPELFFNEMLAVFCRILNDETQIKRYIYLLENLGFHRIGNGGELLKKAADIAVNHKLTGYDAIYAASASLINGTWVTADAKAHKRVASLKISAIL
jgi:predicted nucleic acid-binding protein